MRKPYKSIPVFKNPYLEKLTHVHPVTPLVVWVPIVAYLLWHSLMIQQIPLFEVLSLGIVGISTWTLTEYILHRFVFHYEGKSAWVKKIHFLIHGLHHDDPLDPTRLVMPPAGSLILGLLLYGLFYSLLGRERVDPFFSFFVVGYLAYDYIHFAVHHFEPRTRVGKFLKQSHMLHHYVTPHSRWGVSSPFWDYIFGTLDEESKGKERAAKI